MNVLEGFVKLSTKCEDNCENSWSRINAVEILKVTKPAKKAISDEKVNLGCGNAYSGGSCEDGTNALNCIFDSARVSGIKGYLQAIL